MYEFSQIELKEQDGQLIAIVHMDIDKMSLITEFSTEFGKENDTLQHSAKGFVKKQFPGLKIARVLVVSGAMILANFPSLRASAHEVTFNMSYLYFGNTNSYISQVDKTQGNLNQVSPSYFDLNADGSLKISSQFDPAFVTQMHARGIKVVLESDSSQIDVFVLTKEKKKTEFSVRNVTVTGQE